MEENFKKKALEFNDQYDINLIDTEYYRVFVSHLKDMYPRVYVSLSEASLLEPYLEPKIVYFLQRELEHKKMKYPAHGCKELAYEDVFKVLEDELSENEKIEYSKQFDLDIHNFIDTEEIL